ncbi:MAG: hypothetical protein WAQ53_13155 [Thiofilum sp.]|uniref:hypothetical protein n=1 Tax=Thiofilum sp. TaxID=2212733 RepID=UPI0025D8DFDA|nr:hypothetical protein [Thiofilum sp.]MBK8454211.1 hypothetical protein [Thiofilum sp.]
MKNTILPIPTMAFCLLILTYSTAEVTFAASSRVRTPPSEVNSSSQLTAKQRTQPIHASILTTPNTYWYKLLVENENFMKWQDMARYFWKQQTGEQRLISNSQKRAYKRQPRPLEYFKQPRLR